MESLHWQEDMVGLLRSCLGWKLKNAVDLGVNLQVQRQKQSHTMGNRKKMFAAWKFTNYEVCSWRMNTKVTSSFLQVEVIQYLHVLGIAVSLPKDLTKDSRQHFNKWFLRSLITYCCAWEVLLMVSCCLNRLWGASESPWLGVPYSHIGMHTVASDDDKHNLAELVTTALYWAPESSRKQS